MSDAYTFEPLLQWVEQVTDSRLTPWDRFPEIYLYMDQVLTFMDTQLHLFARERSMLLTSSMINNYVKDGVLPRPEKKKYNRDHLVLLTILCLLKQVLSIQDIHTLLDALQQYEKADVHILYDNFCKTHEQVYQEICTRVEAADKEGEEALTQLAMQLSVEASARRTASERILQELRTKAEAPSSPPKPQPDK